MERESETERERERVFRVVYSRKNCFLFLKRMGDLYFVCISNHFQQLMPCNEAIWETM